jgi:hypothetical protein
MERCSMSRLLGFAIKEGYMKTAKEFPPSSGAEFPGCPEDQHHDQESCSRMDSEGCPNGGAEDDERRVAERATARLWDRMCNLNSRVRRYCGKAA